MSNKKISELTNGTPKSSSIVPVTDTETMTTEKLTLQQIRSLNTVVSLTYDSTLATNASASTITINRDPVKNFTQDLSQYSYSFSRTGVGVNGSNILGVV